jgi:hypothetical protein
MNSLHRMIWLGICVLSCMGWAHRAHAAERTAFYYGARVPTDLIAAYDQVVVEPDHVTNLSAFSRGRARPVAYLSVGEVAKAGEQAKHIKPAWVLTDNLAWSSLVMDLAHGEYRAYLMRRFDELWRAGYQAFFLDTLDSYRLGASGAAAERARQALVAIIVEMKRRHPGARLLLNRGFELLADVKGHVDGVVAESLFDRWDAAKRRYTRVPPEDRKWLLVELRRARDEHGLPVTVIDYRPPAERREARATARKIHDLGFEPWVTDAALDSVGIGSLEILPRRVLILTNDPEAPGGAEPDALRFLAPVIEYLGYVPEHKQVPESWTELELEQGYQGVVTWFSSSALPSGYAAWMSEQIQRGLRFAVFGAPGFDVAGPEARALGISLVAPSSSGAVEVTERDALVGFEAQPPARPFDGPLVRLLERTGTRVHLALKDGTGRRGVAIATTPWGGLALSHVLSLRGLAGERAWVLDPFAFLKRALGLPLAPMPDVTTHNGRRLGMVQVRPRGLGWAAAFEHPSSGVALAEWLSEHHRFPHSVAAAPDTDSLVTEADRRAAQHLLALPFFAAGSLHPGTTRARGAAASLTQVGGMFRGSEPAGPIAVDSAFLPSDGPQAYPYADVVRAFTFTESPRRLKPVLLDYHGFMAASAGGRKALAAVYAWLDGEQLFPIYVHEYAELARSFRTLVVARELNGAFRYFGGERFTTVRVPAELGVPDLLASKGAIGVRASHDGHYVSFMPGAERVLVLGAARLESPHVVQATGEVLQFGLERHSPEGIAVALRVQGHVPLSVELGGLPAEARCELVFARGSLRAVASERGSLVLRLERSDTGNARLRCSTRGDG